MVAEGVFKNSRRTFTKNSTLGVGKVLESDNEESAEDILMNTNKMLTLKKGKKKLKLVRK